MVWLSFQILTICSYYITVQGFLRNNCVYNVIDDIMIGILIKIGMRGLVSYALFENEAFIIHKTNMKMNALGWIAMILLVIGGLNWGLIGIFEWDLIAAIFGDMSVLSRIIYIIIAVAAVYMIISAGLKSGKRE